MEEGAIQTKRISPVMTESGLARHRMRPHRRRWRAARLGPGKAIALDAEQDCSAKQTSPNQFEPTLIRCYCKFNCQVCRAGRFITRIVSDMVTDSPDRWITFG